MKLRRAAGRAVLFTAAGLLMAQPRRVAAAPNPRSAGAFKLTRENQLYQTLLLFRSHAGKDARGVLQFPF